MNRHSNRQKLVHNPTYKKIFTALLGKQHTRGHRICVGVVVMAVGVCTAKSAHYFEAWYTEYTIDGIGYMIHAIGCTPILEEIL